LVDSELLLPAGIVAQDRFIESLLRKYFRNFPALLIFLAHDMFPPGLKLDFFEHRLYDAAQNYPYHRSGRTLYLDRWSTRHPLAIRKRVLQSRHFHLIPHLAGRKMDARNRSRL